MVKLHVVHAQTAEGKSIGLGAESLQIHSIEARNITGVVRTNDAAPAQTKIHLEANSVFVGSEPAAFLFVLDSSAAVMSRILDETPGYNGYPPAVMSRIL